MSLRHADVVHFVGNAFVAKGFENLGVLNEEDTGELKRIADDLAHSVREHHLVTKLAFPHFEAKELSEASALKCEGSIELLLRIAHTMFVVQPEPGEELGRLLFVAHMYERQLRSRCGNLRSLLTDLSDSRHAVRSTELAQEHKQQWTLVAKRGQRSSLLGRRMSELIGNGRSFCGVWHLEGNHFTTEDAEGTEEKWQDL